MQSHLISWRQILVLAAAMPVFGPTTVVAQPLGSKDALKKAFDEHYTRRQQLKIGAEAATAKDAKVATAVAEYSIYRMTHQFEKLTAAQDDFTKELRDLWDKKNERTKRAYIDLLAPECVRCFKDVLERDVKLDATTIIYTAQMLPTLAKLKHDKVAEYLSELIENPKTHDVIRLHALKAMKEVMPIRTQLDMVLWNVQNEKEDFADKIQNAKRKHDVANVDVLVKYIERSVPNMQGDELATLRFLRREAIASLAAAGAPAVTAHPKAPRRPLDGLVAPTLMRVLSKKGLQPPASMNEKIEAAIGLCYLEYPWMPEYHPELGVYLVGQTLVEFINEYNKDLPFFSPEILKGRQPPYLGFKAEGKRFEAALKKLEENARPDSKFSTAVNPAAVKMAADLKTRSKLLLLDNIALYRQADAARLEDLTRWVDSTRPKNGYPFKTLKSPEIPLDR